MSVYGRSISGNSLSIVAERNNIVAEDIATYLESVVFNEYLNFKSIIQESSYFNDTRVLEEKAELLLEISFKDIWEGIKKLIRKLIEFLKGIYEKIKNFIFKKKFKTMKEESKKVEQKVKDLGIQGEKLLPAVVKNGKYELSTTGGGRTELSTTGRKSELDGSSNIGYKILEYCSHVALRDEVYFNMFDYFKKNADPYAFVSGSVFNYIMDELENSNSDVKFSNSLSSIWMNENLSKFGVVKDEILKKFGDGSENGITESMNQVIENDLKKKPRATNMKDFLNYLRYLCEGSQVMESTEIINKYNGVLGKVEDHLKKYYPQENVKSVDNEKLPTIVRTIKTYMSLIDTNVRLISIFSNYTIKASNVATDAVLRMRAMIEQAA